MIKKLFKKLNRAVGEQKSQNKPLSRKNIEERAIESAKKAVKTYRRVFERLAEYDRT